MSWRTCCRATAFNPRWSTALTSTSGARRCGRNQDLLLESPTNPTLDVLDIGAIAEIAHQGGARLIVDNVFATPIWQSPLSLGADVVVYSATKHIDGQGRCLGGIILSSEAFIAEHIHNFMRQTGPSISPFNAWVLLKGAGNAGRCGCARRPRARRHRRGAGAASENLAADLSGRADHPQAALVKKQMRAASTLVGFEVRAARRRRSAPQRDESLGYPTISATPRASSPIPRPRRING